MMLPLVVLFIIHGCRGATESDAIVLGNGERNGPRFASNANPQLYMITSPNQDVDISVEVEDNIVDTMVVYAKVGSVPTHSSYDLVARTKVTASLQLDACLSGIGTDPTQSSFAVYVMVFPDRVASAFNVYITMSLAVPAGTPGEPAHVMTLGDASAMTVLSTPAASVSFVYFAVPSSWSSRAAAAGDTLLHKDFFTVTVDAEADVALVVGENRASSGHSTCPGMRGTSLGTVPASSSDVSFQVSSAAVGVWVGVYFASSAESGDITLSMARVAEVECVAASTILAPVGETPACTFVSSYKTHEGLFPLPSGAWRNPNPNPFEAVEEALGSATSQCLAALRAYYCALEFPSCGTTIKRMPVCSRACEAVAEFCSSSLSAAVSCSSSNDECTEPCPTNYEACDPYFTVPPPPPPPPTEATCGVVTVPCDGVTTSLMVDFTLPAAATTQSSMVVTLTLRGAVGNVKMFQSDSDCPSSISPCKANAGGTSTICQTCGADCLSITATPRGPQGTQGSLRYMIESTGTAGCVTSATVVLSKVQSSDNLAMCTKALHANDLCTSASVQLLPSLLVVTLALIYYV